MTDKILVAGDWHGNTIWAKSVIEYAAEEGCDTIYQVGDFGHWVPGSGMKYFMMETHKALEQFDVTLYWLDGNHECIDTLTKAVTRRGFVSVDELRGDDQVLSIDDNGDRLWMDIDAIIKKHYTGPMHRVSTVRHDMLMTPGHRVVGLNSGRDKWIERLAGELNTVIKIPCSARGGRIDADIHDDIIKLHAWCLTDSSRIQGGGWRFYQRESAADRIVSLLERLGITHSISIRHRHITEICGRTVRSTEPEVTVSIGVREGRKLPFRAGKLDEFVWKLSERQVQVFMNELVFCDGSMAPSGTSSGVLYGGPADADWWNDLQLLLAMNGYRTSRSVFRGQDWRLNFCRRLDIELSPKSVSVEDYDGSVWCLQVANGRFFVERNGKIYLTGNCHPDIQHRLNGSREAQPLYKKYPRIIHLPRGYRWEMWDKTWMAVGGAYSVDSHLRKPGKSWWPEEVLSDEDVEYASRPGGVDVMLSHDCPWGVDIPGLDPLAWPKHQLDKAHDHQRLLREVVDVTRPSFIVHGHMHVSYWGGLEYSDGKRATVRGLDCDGSHQRAHTLILRRQDD